MNAEFSAAFGSSKATKGCWPLHPDVCPVPGVVLLSKKHISACVAAPIMLKTDAKTFINGID